MNISNDSLKEIQKAYEDVIRDAFDYYLDMESGEVIILSEDIISAALKIMNEAVGDDEMDFEEVEFDREYDIPEWIEGEIELALDIFLYDKERYVRIPERDQGKAFESMQGFIESLDNVELREDLIESLQGKGSFRRFKDIISRYTKERRLWYGYNSQAISGEIQEWLNSIGIE